MSELAHPMADFESQRAKEWFASSDLTMRGDDGDAPLGAFPAPGLGATGPIRRRFVEPRITAEYLEDVAKDLRDVRLECYRRARQTFNLCITLAIVSAVTIYAIAIFATFSPTTLKSILPELGTLISLSSSALAYRMYRLEGRRAAEMDRDLIRIEKVRLQYLERRLDSRSIFIEEIPRKIESDLKPDSDGE